MTGDPLAEEPCCSYIPKGYVASEFRLRCGDGRRSCVCWGNKDESYLDTLSSSLPVS